MGPHPSEKIVRPHSCSQFPVNRVPTKKENSAPHTPNGVSPPKRVQKLLPGVVLQILRCIDPLPHPQQDLIVRVQAMTGRQNPISFLPGTSWADWIG